MSNKTKKPRKRNKTPEIVFLKGKRVTMRPVGKEDVPLLLRWMNDPEVRQYLNRFTPIAETEETAWVESVGSRQSTNIVFVIEVCGVPIGTMGIHSILWKDRTATTGAAIGNKDYWGKGYGTEAKALLLEYAFDVLNLRKINSEVFEFNKRSRAYMVKSGYVEEGRLKKQRFKHRKYVDVVLYAIFRKDWRKRQKTSSKKKKT